VLDRSLKRKTLLRKSTILLRKSWNEKILLHEVVLVVCRKLPDCVELCDDPVKFRTLLTNGKQRQRLDNGTVGNNEREVGIRLLAGGCRGEHGRGYDRKSGRGKYAASLDSWPMRSEDSTENKKVHPLGHPFSSSQR